MQKCTKPLKQVLPSNQICTKTEWFECTSGVRQGDILSTILFCVFINDLAQEIKSMNIGINIDNIKVAILLYADDIILLTDNKVDSPNILDKLNEWCKKVHECKFK